MLVCRDVQKITLMPTIMGHGVVMSSDCYRYLVTNMIGGKVRDDCDLTVVLRKWIDVPNVPSGHIGYDSLMCGQSYLECKTQNGQKAECIDYDLPKILGKDDKIHGK